MKLQSRLLTAAAVLSLFVANPQARALVSLEDGRDHIFVDGTVALGYDSNVFANAQSGGSLVTEGSLGINFTRRAGWIGVNASAEVDFANYGRFHTQDYADPKVTAELTKQTGRTTGSLTMSIQKQDRADVTVNTRDTAWIYDVGLNVQYPVIERYSLTGTLDWNRTDYEDHDLFTNLTVYTGNLYLYYILNDERDLFIDARGRYTDEADGEYDIDKALSAGVSGRVYGPFNGSLQFGFQNRTSYVGVNAGNYNDVTASGTATWNMNRRMTLTAMLSRDFSTTATAQSIEDTNASLTFQDSLTAKASFTLIASVGENRFLGDEGLLTDGERRVDDYYALSAQYYYTLNQHLKFSLTYSYYRSYSTLAYAEFPRHQVFLSLISHW
jgi:hypothetical protein